MHRNDKEANASVTEAFERNVDDEGLEENNVPMDEINDEAGSEEEDGLFLNEDK
jgi:hypothetical protein